MFKKFAAVLFGIGPVALAMACDGSQGRDLTGPEREPATLEANGLSSLSATNIWADRRSMLDPARWQMKAGVFNGIIYVVGGRAGSGSLLSTVDAYNVATNTWSRRQPLPSSRSSIHGVSHINGKLYVTGGVRPPCPVPCNGSTRSLFVYTPASNSWVRGADMPVSGTGAGGAQGVIGGLLYVYVPGNNTFFRYSPATNAWTQRAAPPVRHVNGVGGIIDGKFYLVGGQGESDNFATRILNVYNPATNSWTTKASMLNARHVMFGGVINGKLYVAGGMSDQGDMLKTSEVYDPVLDRWTAGASMLAEQTTGASTVVGGRLFVMGGASATDITRRVQRYTP